MLRRALGCGFSRDESSLTLATTVSTLPHKPPLISGDPLEQSDLSTVLVIKRNGHCRPAGFGERKTSQHITRFERFLRSSRSCMKRQVIIPFARLSLRKEQQTLLSRICLLIDPSHYLGNNYRESRNLEPISLSDEEGNAMKCCTTICQMRSNIQHLTDKPRRIFSLHPFHRAQSYSRCPSFLEPNFPVSRH